MRWLNDWIFSCLRPYSGATHCIRGIREKPDENGDDFFRLAAWLIASFRSVFSSSQRLRVACISAIIDMALRVSFHAALLSFGNASMMSCSVYEVALSGSTIFRRSATRRAGSVSPLFLSSVREICISRLSLLIRRFCSPRSVSIPRVSIAQADFPR
ncbi:hypothetical protein HmCms163_04180 [Escherichia coli]|nr:hypothetical protein HmCms163_04180 [Escherichia coli]